MCNTVYFTIQTDAIYFINKCTRISENWRDIISYCEVSKFHTNNFFQYIKKKEVPTMIFYLHPHFMNSIS